MALRIGPKSSFAGENFEILFYVATVGCSRIQTKKREDDAPTGGGGVVVSFEPIFNFFNFFVTIPRWSLTVLDFDAIFGSNAK